MSVESVTQAVSGLALAFSDQDDATYAMVWLEKLFKYSRNWKITIKILFKSRPFGVALLFAGVDESGPHL